MMVPDEMAALTRSADCTFQLRSIDALRVNVKLTSPSSRSALTELPERRLKAKCDDASSAKYPLNIGESEKLLVVHAVLVTEEESEDERPTIDAERFVDEAEADSMEKDIAIGD